MRQLPTKSLPCTTDGDQLGTLIPTRDLAGKTVFGGAGYTGNITVEGRQAAKWSSLGVVAANGVLKIDGSGLVSVEAIRTNCTTVTGGDAPTATFAAFDARED